MWVRFTQDCEVKDHDGNIVETFTAGQVVDLSPASARRWIRRSKAEEVSAPQSELAAPLEQETTPAVEFSVVAEPTAAVESVEEAVVAGETPDQGESQLTGLENGEEVQSSSSQVDPVLPSKTLSLSGSGKRGRRRRAT